VPSSGMSSVMKSMNYLHYHIQSDKESLHLPFEIVWRTFVRLGRIMIKVMKCAYKNVLPTYFSTVQNLRFGSIHFVRSLWSQTKIWEGRANIRERIFKPLFK